MGRMDGKIAVVTGAARGMGRECAERLAAEGATVIATDVIEPEVAFDEIEFQKLDVSDEADWTRVIDGAREAHGRIDVLVNNAGIIAYEDIESVSLEAWNKVIGVNLTGTMLGMQKVVPIMKENGGGAIVNFSSIWGNAAVAGAAGYHATKGAVRNLTKNAAITYAEDGIRANSVHPGFIGPTPEATFKDHFLTSLHRAESDWNPQRRPQLYAASEVRVQLIVDPIGILNYDRNAKPSPGYRNIEASRRLRRKKLSSRQQLANGFRGHDRHPVASDPLRRPEVENLPFWH